MQTIAQRLARHVCGLAYTDIPGEALAHAKTLIAHDLIVGVLGSRSQEAQTAIRFINGPAGSSGVCSVIRQRTRYSVLDAAFANTVMIRTTRQQSTLLPAGINGGAIMIPVALALGEQLQRDGREILAALIAGFDVCGKLDAIAPHKRMVRTASHVYGAFGAAAVAAKLLRLDLEQTAIALAYAGNLALMITGGFGDHQYGLLARNGLTAAYLGQARAPAPPHALEGTLGFYQSQLGCVPEDFDGVLATLGVDYEVTRCCCKLIPGTGAIAHEILRQLLAEQRIAADRITRIVVRRPPETHDDLKHAVGPFANHVEALSSVPLALAALLLDGRVTAERFEFRHNDAAVLRIARLVEFADTVPSAMSRQTLEVHTSEGRIYRADGDYTMLVPPAPDDIVRFHDSPILDAEGAAELAAAVAQLETLASASELTRLLIAR
jgi:2-methylcitrate dehydratase PrpD